MARGSTVVDSAGNSYQPAGTIVSGSNLSQVVYYATNIAAAAAGAYFGAGMTVGGFTGATGGFTQRVITAPDADIVEDRIVSSAGLLSARPPRSAARG